MAATTQAAVNIAEIVYFRARKASAISNGGASNSLAAEVANATLALAGLGTGGN